MSASAPALGTIQVTPRRGWIAFAVILLGAVMSLLDTTIVNVALPTIKTSLNADEATLSWIISGYALAFGLSLIPAGRIGDRLGHKWVFFIGIALFTAVAFACGIASSDTQLIVFRVVQGLAGGIFVPAVTAFIQLLFPPQVRGRAFAIMGTVIGVSTALGPIVGGLLIQAFGDTNGWRTVFYVNLPIGVAALILAALWLPKRDKSAPRPPAGLDWFGVFLVSVALVAILVPLIQGQQDGWPLWTYLTIAAGVVVLVIFALWEVRVAAPRRQPPRAADAVQAPAVHRRRHPRARLLRGLHVSIFFTISLLWQTGLAHTALGRALVTIPFAVGSRSSARRRATGSRPASAAPCCDRHRARRARPDRALDHVLTIKGTDLTNWMLLPALFVAGVGNGLFIAPNAQFIVATVDPSEAGAASGVIAAMQRSVRRWASP